MTRITTTGRDSWSSRGQMSEARRQHVYGKLEPLPGDQPAERPVFRLRELVPAVALLLGLCGAVVLWSVVL